MILLFNLCSALRIRRTSDPFFCNCSHHTIGGLEGRLVNHQFLVKRINPLYALAVIWEEAGGLLNQVPRKSVRLAGVGIYQLIGENGRQLRFEDFMPEVQEQREEKIRAELNRLKRRYGLDFAGNLDKIFRGETLYRTIEYMRKHYADDPTGSGSGNDSR